MSRVINTISLSAIAKVVDSDTTLISLDDGTKVNMWSRHKGVNSDKVGTLTEEDFAALNYGVGVNIGSMTTLANAVSSTTYATSWTRPSSVRRLSDWCGYSADAKPLLANAKTTFKTTGDLSYRQLIVAEGVENAPYYTEIDVPVDSITDVDLPLSVYWGGNGTYYPALVFVGEDTSKSWVVTVELGEDRTQYEDNKPYQVFKVYFPSAIVPIGQYKVCLVLSTSQFGTNRIIDGKSYRIADVLSDVSSRWCKSLAGAWVRTGSFNTAYIFTHTESVRAVPRTQSAISLYNLSLSSSATYGRASAITAQFYVLISTDGASPSESQYTYTLTANYSLAGADEQYSGSALLSQVLTANESAGLSGGTLQGKWLCKVYRDGAQVATNTGVVSVIKPAD